MRARGLIYLVPAAVSLATGVLAVACLLQGIKQIDGPFCGFFFHANGTVASMQRGHWEGMALGLRPGDVVVSADGRRMGDGDELSRWLAGRREGQTVTLEVHRPTEARTWPVQVRLRRLTTADFLATFVLPYSIGVVYLLIGALIFFLKRTYEAALALSICVLASIFYMATFDAHTSHHFARIWIFYSLLGAISVHLFSVFPARRRAHRTVVLAVPYVVGIAIQIFAQLTMHRWEFALRTSLLSTGFLSLCFVADIFILTRSAHHDPSEDIRNKAKTIRAGLLVTVAAGLVWSLVARFRPELITAERAMMLSALFPVLLAYAATKKNLFDVEIFLRTTAIYAVATALVVLLYFAVVFVLGLAMSAWTRRHIGLMQNVEAAVISTLVVALIFHPVRVGVQRVVDRFFFRAKGQLQEALVRLGQELAGMTPNLTALGQHLTARVQSLMRCRFVVLLARTPARRGFRVVAVADAAPATLLSLSLPGEGPVVAELGEEPLRVARDELSAEALGVLGPLGVSALVPLRTATGPVGLMLLGPRQHGDVFTRFDMGALRSLALPAALALENSLLLGEHAERERLAALGKLSAVIIHEIKNPLGIIRVSSGTLKKRFDSSDSGFELASFIEEEVVRMNHTIAQFLVFARPSQPKPTRFDLAELVRRTAAAARGELEQAKIALETALESPVPVLADADQVQQVLLNLIVNARQVLEGRPDGRVRLVVSRQARVVGIPPAGELQVIDNGPGVDPTVLERLFEPFVTTRQGGTGLGLAIARQLLVEQGGQISCHSEPDAGTTFTVTLPG
jgi:signal transduction histidine kinase